MVEELILQKSPQMFDLTDEEVENPCEAAAMTVEQKIKQGYHFR